MRKIRCCIIDDEPLALGLIKTYVEQTPFLELVGTFQNAMEAIKTIVSGELDLVFLDIQMAELNGIEFASVIPERIRIIFITAFQQYALDAFKANAIDYLLKPVNYSEFLHASNKALRWFELNDAKGISYESQDNNENDCIIVKSEYKLIQIPIEDIIYIEGLKDYVKIFTINSEQPILSLISLKILESRLPESKFIRVHRSFIVQKNKIRTIERNRIVFGKQYIPISDTYKDAFSEYVSQHLLATVKDNETTDNRQ